MSSTVLKSRSNFLTLPKLDSVGAWMRLNILKKARTVTSSLELGRIVGSLYLNDDTVGLRTVERIVRERAEQPVDSFVYLKLIQSRLQSDQTVQALELFRLMCQRKVVPGDSVYSTLMAKLTKDDRPQMALKVYEQAILRNAKLDSSIYNALIMTCAKLGDVSAMKKIVVRMKNAGCELSVATYTALMSGFLMNRDDEGVVRAWHAMEKRGIEPDSRAWRLLIAALGRLRGAFEAEEALRRCPQQTDETWNAALAVYCAEKRQLDATRLFHEMVGAGFTPNLETFNHLVRVANPNTVMKYMELHNVEPTHVTYEVIMKRYAREGKHDLAYLAEIQLPTLPVSGDKNTALAKAFVRASQGDLKGTREALGKRRDTPALNMILKAHYVNKDSGALFRLFRKMIQHSIVPDIETFTLLIRHHADRKDITGVELAYKDLTDRKIKPTQTTYSILVRARFEAKDSLGIVKGFMDACADGFDSPILRNKTIRALERLGQSSYAQQIREME